MRYLSAHYVLHPCSEPLRYGIVCVDNDRVVRIIDTKGRIEEREKLEFYNGVLMVCSLEAGEKIKDIPPGVSLNELKNSTCDGLKNEKPDVFLITSVDYREMRTTEKSTIRKIGC